MKESVLVMICARGGSKGIPGKNIKPLNGKPLIAYSIDLAKKLEEFFNVSIALSTDSDKIKLVAKEFCFIETEYIRPNYLANDKAGKLDVFYDIYNFHKTKGNKYDYVLDLDVSSPLRTQEDLNLAFKKLIDNHDAINVFSVSEAKRNPYFNMVELNDEGYCQLVKKSFAKTRQSSPEVFDMNASFYFYKRVFFEKNYKSAITNKSLHYLMNHTCFDLDDPLDFQIMEFLISQNKLKIKI